MLCKCCNQKEVQSHIKGRSRIQKLNKGVDFKGSNGSAMVDH